MDRAMQRLFCLTIILSTLIFLVGCGGDSSSKSTPDAKPTAVYAVPVIETNTSIATNSGAFTLIEWGLTSEDENTTLEIKQISGVEDILITLPESEKGTAYFNAPIIEAPNTDYQFEITATNSQGSSTTTVITLEILPAGSAFKQPRRVFDYELNGSEITYLDVNRLGNYFIVSAGIDGFSNVTKAFRWLGDKLEEVVDIDPIYLRDDIKLFDINNDGVEDVLFIKEVEDEELCSSFTSRNAQLMVKYGTNEGFENETSLTNLGCLYVDDYYSISSAEDINNDGYLDLNMYKNVPEISRSFAYFYIYSPETNHYTALSLGENERLVDINGDKYADKISINDVFSCTDYFAVCGILQYQLQQPDMVFGEWKNFKIDSEFSEYGRFESYDINQDKINDVTIYAGRALDTEPTQTHWFELTEQGDFQHHQIERLPAYYADLYASGIPYFFDIQGTKLIKYKYNELVHSPVIDEVQKFPFTDARKHFYDVDKDGDIDVLILENGHIMMVENSFIQ
ncbi:hypothetical protein [Thalassotalea sediminis]|uniref:hypothetical protein n=1 Tax=Thalassotalea sediminis TaxID=1759089 RepID=UPI002573DE7E|nr:hypothetical protein [Thalassotalea sediminis]